MGFRYDVMRKAAFEAKGREWRNVIVVWEVAVIVGPWVLLAAALGALGLLAREAWLAVTDAFSAPDTVAPGTDAVSVAVDTGGSFGAVPGWLWIAVVALLLALVWIFRPGRLVTSLNRSTVLIQAAVVVVGLAGVAGVILSHLTGF